MCLASSGFYLNFIRIGENENIILREWTSFVKSEDSPHYSLLLSDNNEMYNNIENHEPQ